MSKIYIDSLYEIKHWGAAEDEQQVVVSLGFLRDTRNIIFDLINYAEASTLEEDAPAQCVIDANEFLEGNPP